MLTRFAFRIVALACAWASLVTMVHALTEAMSPKASSVITIVTFVTGVLLFGVSVALWRGSRHE